MHLQKFAITAAAVMSALALPGLSQATTVYHASGGEVSFTYHPDHAKGGKSRAEVLAELEAARKDGTLAMSQRIAPIPVQFAGTAKTRQQVVDEMRSETPEQRQARREMSIGG